MPPSLFVLPRALSFLSPPLRARVYKNKSERRRGRKSCQVLALLCQQETSPSRFFFLSLSFSFLLVRLIFLLTQLLSASEGVARSPLSRSLSNRSPCPFSLQATRRDLPTVHLEARQSVDSPARADERVKGCALPLLPLSSSSSARGLRNPTKKKNEARRLRPACQGVLAATTAGDTARRQYRRARNGRHGGARRRGVSEEKLRCGGGNASCIVVVGWFSVSAHLSHRFLRRRRRLRLCSSGSDLLAAILHHRRQGPDRRRADARARQDARRGVDRRVRPARGGRRREGAAGRARRGRSVRVMRRHRPRRTEQR